MGLEQSVVIASEQVSIIKQEREAMYVSNSGPE